MCWQAQAPLKSIHGLRPKSPSPCRNAGSIGVHATLVVSHVGVLKSLGWKLQRWLDVVVMEKPLGAGDSNPPQ